MHNLVAIEKEVTALLSMVEKADGQGWHRGYVDGRQSALNEVLRMVKGMQKNADTSTLTNSLRSRDSDPCARP